MKQLSTISLKDKKITIQTEFAQHPKPHVRTLAYIEGKILIKREHDVESDIKGDKLESMITRQHITVENEIKFKLSSALTKKK